MASYVELAGLTQDEGLIARLSIAVAVAAEGIRTEDPPVPSRVNWAVSALANPDGRARGLVWLLLAQNKDLTVAQIQGVTDAQLQAAVNAAVTLLSS